MSRRPDRSHRFGEDYIRGRHFLATEVLSSDTFRGLVSDDENDQSATADAFEALHLVLRKRLAAGRLTVVDATNVQARARRGLTEIADAAHLPRVAIVLDVPKRICEERNARRPDRQNLAVVLDRQHHAFLETLRVIATEGFAAVWRVGVDQVDSVVVVRKPRSPGSPASPRPPRRPRPPRS